MSQPENLHKFVTKAAYYYSLVLGLLPAQYDSQSQTFIVNKYYLYYSALVQIAYLLITPLSSPFFKHQKNFMDNKPILQWSYLVGKTVRILTIVVISGKTWLKREHLKTLLKTYQELLRKYQWFHLYFTNNFSHEFAAEKRRLQQFVFLKFLTLQLNPLIIQIIYLSFEKTPGWHYYILVLVNFLQMLHLVVACLQLTLVLCEIQWYFYRLNKTLEIATDHRFPKHFLCYIYTTIYKMHVDGQQLASAWLGACNAVMLFMLMKMFTTNIIILYHAVLMATGILPADKLMISVCICCIAIFYCDNFLNTLATDKALGLANQTANILKATWLEMEEFEDVGLFTHVTQVLDQFSDYLACHKLKFCIYGLVNFNKAASFQYFVAAILHLIILVQFDLQYR